MENPAWLRPGRRRGRLAAGAAAALVLAAGPGRPAVEAVEDPVTDVTRAIESLGGPGALWGRLAVEEESPAGPWTPLGGVEVALYPATPGLLGELERIRRSARASGPEHESAVARVRAALAAHQARVDTQGKSPSLAQLAAPAAESPSLAAEPTEPALAGSHSPSSGPSSGSGRRLGGGTRSGVTTAEAEGAGADRHPFRQSTDAAGLFAFDRVPAGDWLVVAIRVAPYAGQKLRGEPRPRAPSRGLAFAPRARTGPPREAELWVHPVRVEAGARLGLTLTDRARWLVGPVR